MHRFSKVAVVVGVLAVSACGGVALATGDGADQYSDQTGVVELVAPFEDMAQSGSQSGSIDIDADNAVANDNLDSSSSVKLAELASPEVLAAAAVEDVGGLQAAIDAAVEDTVITLGGSFPSTLPTQVNLTSNSDFSITIDGAGKTLLPPPSGRHFNVTVSGAGSFAMRNMTLTTTSGDTTTHGGLTVTQQGSAAVELSDLDFLNIRGGALALRGNGTGQATITNSTFEGNIASTAAAFVFGRTAASAETTISHSTFKSNIGTSGSGYSGGAIRMDAGSWGKVTFADSAFVGNQFLEGGSHPRGGAIAAHNSSVQLYLERDYFQGNSTASAGTPANADGGAVSVFNSNSNTTGSLFVMDSTFEGNIAQDDGAAIFVEGRAPSQSGPFSTTLVVENSTFIGNKSGDYSSDTGGAIQTSLRVKADFTHNTFVGNSKDNNRGGVDIGGHSGFDTSTFQIMSPTMTATNNIFTRSNSLDSYTKCYSGVGCTGTITKALEAEVLLDVFGTSSPVASVNGSARIAGDSREGKDSYPVTTVAIAPPLTDTSFTAYRTGTASTDISVDQRGVPFKVAAEAGKLAPDAGSLEMEFVKFDAATNGGTWSGLTASFPLSGSSYFAGDNAASGWFEVATAGTAVRFPTEPTAPAGKVFSGWFSQATEGTEVTEGPLASGQTVYAQFKDATLVVTFDSDGGSVVEPVDVLPGEKVDLPEEPTKDGFIFQGWQLDGVAYDFDTPVTEDITLIASWKAIVTIQADNLTFVYGNPAPLTATLSDASATGRTTFSIAGEVITTAVVTADGTSVLPANALSAYNVGDHRVLVSYLDDEGRPIASTSATVTVTPASTTTSLNLASTRAVTDDKEFQVSGQVTGQYGTIPTGSVTLSMDGVPVGAPMSLDDDGRYTGTVSVERLESARQVNLVSTYSTDLNHLASSTVKAADIDAETIPTAPVTPPAPVAPEKPGTEPSKPSAELSKSGADGIATTVAVSGLLLATGAFLALRSVKVRRKA